MRVILKLMRRCLKENAARMDAWTSAEALSTSSHGVAHSFKLSKMSYIAPRQITPAIKCRHEASHVKYKKLTDCPARGAAASCERLMACLRHQHLPQVRLGGVLREALS